MRYGGYIGIRDHTYLYTATTSAKAATAGIAAKTVKVPWTPWLSLYEAEIYFCRVEDDFIKYSDTECISLSPVVLTK